MPNFDEVSILFVKHNPLAVCLQKTFLKDTDTITVSGFNLYQKFQETESRVSGSVSIHVNENIPQTTGTLTTNLQTVPGKVTAHKNIAIISTSFPNICMILLTSSNLPIRFVCNS